MADNHRNFSYGNIIIAPSPPQSGTSLTLDTGQGLLFPPPPFNATVWPINQRPLSTNAEIVRVTAINGDVLTIQRAQEGSTARSIIIGDQIASGVTAKVLTDIENSIPSSTASLSDATDKRFVTDAQRTVLNNTSGANTGDQTLAGLGGVPTSRTVNGQPLSSNVSLTKSDVGLSNVDNTSDANKPISTAEQAALNAKAATPVYALLANGTLAMAFGTNTVVKVTPTATGTYTTTVPPAGTHCHLIILTTGAVSFTITFGAGFKPTATLATGVTAARVFVLSFISDGTNLYEVSRTIAMVA